tara:strand:- start:2924 stop:3250 length:327 start_codon:yes stop_codon:yes gene_type:complete
MAFGLRERAPQFSLNSVYVMQEISLAHRFVLQDIHLQRDICHMRDDEAYKQLHQVPLKPDSNPLAGFDKGICLPMFEYRDLLVVPLLIYEHEYGEYCHPQLQRGNRMQ